MKRRVLYTLPKNTNLLDGKVITDVIARHQTDRQAFSTLESYLTDEPSMSREAPNELLTRHDFAGYIVNLNVSHMVGNPVDYVADGKESLDALVENYEEQSVDELDLELASDLSTYGQAFELTYRNEETKIRSAKMSVYNTVVLYDDTVQHNKIGAIYYAKTEANREEYDVTIYTPTHVYQRRLANNVLTGDEDELHGFGATPVTHYWNNRRLKGDYESVISLIDAYNILQSDRVLDREKLVDAILAFYGATLTPEDQKNLKESRTIAMPEGSKAEYLIKSIDEADADVLRRTLAQDIHKFSMTPDLSDESFNDAPSGVSILYKLLAFEQNIKKKERLFAMGLRERLTLYAQGMSLTSRANSISPQKVSIVFRRELPKNDYETSQMINNLIGTVDQETLVGRLSFVDDASKVVEKAREENQTALAGNFGTDQPED